MTRHNKRDNRRSSMNKNMFTTATTALKLLVRCCWLTWYPRYDGQLTTKTATVKYTIAENYPNYDVVTKP
jgi:hypothetical protein